MPLPVTLCALTYPLAAALNVDAVSVPDLEDTLMNGIWSCIPGQGDLADIDLCLYQYDIKDGSQTRQVSLTAIGASK